MDSIPTRKGIQILKGKSSRACRSTAGRPTHATVDRPGRSHLPESRSSSIGRPGPVGRSNSRAGHFSRSIGAGRPILTVHARARWSTRPVDQPPPPVDGDVDREKIWPVPCAASRSFVIRSLCYLLPSPLSPLSHNSTPR